MHDGKRWMTIALRSGVGWSVTNEKVGPLGSLLARLRDRAGSGAVAFGVDAPIGLPLAYRRPFEWFPEFVASLQADDPFYQVCDRPDEISLDRPFYPRSSLKGARRLDQLEQMGLSGSEMLRRCERAIAPQQAASSLFWTLGAKQAGKGAICLWRDLLGDALRAADPPALWPFDGTLATLMTPGRTVIAETYPADAMHQMKLGFTGSKRRQSDRKAAGHRLRALAEALGATPDDALAAQIQDGFGPGGDGEDRFDSLIGLLRMLQIVRDPALDQLPDPVIRRWEGWILGRPVSID